LKNAISGGDEMEKKVLILSDFVGLGNVAMATTRAVLTKLGCTALCLPTALISNTWNYGACAQLDTTAYLQQSLAQWQALGIHFDAVLIGYIAGEEQARWIGGLCEKWRDAGVRIFLDPIFADNGRLYKGITPQRLDDLRQLLKKADYVLPNSTEACFLAQTDEPEEAARKLAELGNTEIVVTGADSTVLLGRDHRVEWHPYVSVPGNYPGAGDAFTALFMGNVLAGLTPSQSIDRAIGTTASWIRRSLAEDWQGMGLPVERYF